MANKHASKGRGKKNTWEIMGIKNKEYLIKTNPKEIFETWPFLGKIRRRPVDERKEEYIKST